MNGPSSKDLAVGDDKGRLEGAVALLPTPTARLGDSRGPQASRYEDPERSNDLDDAVAWATEQERWGKYASAIARAASLLGRPPPEPLRGKSLNPRFVEWMMMLPEGHVTEVPGLSKRAQLRLLGNGWVPPVARAAFADMAS